MFIRSVDALLVKLPSPPAPPLPPRMNGRKNIRRKGTSLPVVKQTPEGVDETDMLGSVGLPVVRRPEWNEKAVKKRVAEDRIQ